jgi:hypothetical protein
VAARFTAAGPAVADGQRLWLDVEIGFEHTVDAEGVVSVVVDVDGNPVTRSYRLPLVVTARDAIEASNRVVATLAKYGETLQSVSAGAYRVDVHEDVMLSLITALVGESTVFTIAKDPTVDPADFEALMEHLLDVWGFGTLLTDLFGDGGEFDPKD